MEQDSGRRALPRPPSPRPQTNLEAPTTPQQADESHLSPAKSHLVLTRHAQQPLFRSPPSPAHSQPVQSPLSPTKPPDESITPKKGRFDSADSQTWADQEADEDPDAGVDSVSALGHVFHFLVRAFIFSPSVVLYVTVSILLCPLRLLEILLHKKGLYCWEQMPLYHFHRGCLRWLIFTLGIRVHVKGEWPQPRKDAESRRAYLVAFNHTSALDGVFIAAYTPVSVSFVAKAETMYYPFVNALFFVYGVVFVNRSKRSAAIRSLKKAALDIKKSKKSIAISPEGTRSRNGRLASFKKGAFHLACDARIPILPVAIHGAFRLCPKNCLYPRMGSVVIQSSPAIVIDEAKLGDEDSEESSPESYRAQLARSLWDALSIMLGHTRSADLVHRPKLPGENPIVPKVVPKFVRRVDVSSAQFSPDNAEPPVLPNDNVLAESTVFFSRTEVTQTHSVAVRQIQMHSPNHQVMSLDTKQQQQQVKPKGHITSQKKAPFHLNIPTPFTKKTNMYPSTPAQNTPHKSKPAFNSPPKTKESGTGNQKTQMTLPQRAEVKVPALPPLPPVG